MNTNIYVHQVADERPGISRGIGSLPMLLSAVAGCLLLSYQVALAADDSWKHFENGGVFATASPSISPDGESLAYASPCTGHGDIYVIKSGSQNPTRLTNSDDFESSPMFTPDGKRIVFVREHEGDRHIWIMDADGSHPQQLIRGNARHDPQALSADGRYLMFTRSAAAGGLGRIARMALVRVDKTTEDPTDVGDIAVLSPNSKFVVYSDKAELWRLELGDKERARRRLYGTGWPLDTSEDGRVVVVGRRQATTEWTGDDEIWAVDTEKNAERKLAIGHYPVLFGPKRTNMLFFVGTGHLPYVTTIDGGEIKQIQCPETYKTAPRVSWDGRGATVASVATRGRPKYDVYYIDFKELRAMTIASIACSGSMFHSATEKSKE